MSAIFISHSSKDNDSAAELGRLLADQGYHSLFLDFDPEQGIPAGREWEQELYGQLRSSQAVIVLCSKDSMASMWCFAEITHAKALGKHVFPIKVGDCVVSTILTSKQVLDLTKNKDDAYHRLWGGLKVLGMDARDAFDWDPKRAPYPGLLAFQEADAAIFFGREPEIQEGLEKLNRLRQFGGSRLLMVLGASGSGKSSLVRAGLLPRLRRDAERWLILPPFRPGKDPIKELALSLEQAFQSLGKTRDWQSIVTNLNMPAGDVAASGSALIQQVQDLLDAAHQREAAALFSIDQMEELFTFKKGAGAGQLLPLLKAALETAGCPFMAVGTLRSDFLGQFQMNPSARGLAFADLRVGPLPAERLSRVIEGPANMAGIRLEDGLTEALMQDTGTDALPLLAFALRELYEAYAGDKLLTVNEYRKELGGLVGSVARAAEAVYTARKLSPGEESDLRSAFRAMVRVDERGAYVRQSASTRNLPPAVAEILERFVQARLLVAGGEGEEQSLEVTHEVLFRGWERLRQWLDEDREFLLWQKRLRDAVAGWQEAGQDPGALLRGAPLVEAERHAQNHPDAMNDAEHSFIEQSLALREKEKQDREQARQEREAMQRRSNQRLRAFLAVALVLLLVAVGSFWTASRSAKRAIKAEAHALAEKGTAVSEGEKARQALSQSDVLRATELLRENDPRATQEALAFLARACRTNPGNEVAATRLFSLLSQRDWILPLTATAPHANLKIHRVFFHPARENSVFATQTSVDDFRASDDERSVWVWDAKTAKLLFGPERCEAGGNERWFSPKGDWILIPFGREVKIVNFRTKNVRKSLNTDANVKLAQFSPDGATILTCGEGGEMAAWDAESGLRRKVAAKLPSAPLELSPDGTRACMPAVNAEKYVPARVWKLDLAAGTAVPLGVARPSRGDDRVEVTNYLSPDGRKLCAARADGRFEFSEIDSNAKPRLGIPLAPPAPNQLSRIFSLTFSRDGRRVVTTNLDHDAVLSLWDFASAKEIAQLQHHTGEDSGGFIAYGGNFSPDGLRVVSYHSGDRSVRLWDGRDGAPLKELPRLNRELGSAFTDGIFGPDGTLVTATRAGDVQTWDVQPTVPLEWPRRLAESRVESWGCTARFSQDAKVLRLVHLKEGDGNFDVETGRPAPELPEFSKADSNEPDIADPTGKRRFENMTDIAGEKLHLVDVAGDHALKCAVLCHYGHFKFSPDGKKLIVIDQESAGGWQGKLLSAETGLPLRERFAQCYNAWFSPEGAKIIVAAGGSNGVLKTDTRVEVVDIASGVALIDPLVPVAGMEAAAAAFTPGGIIVAFAGHGYVEIQRLDFLLNTAPALLADVADTVANRSFSDAGILTVRSAPVSLLRERLKGADQTPNPPLFSQWLQWFLAPSENRPVAPGSPVTLAQYFEQYGKMASDDSLHRAELLAGGDAELRKKIASLRAARKAEEAK